ncbi:ATP-dependent helicase HrpB [Pseudokineococcus lusitanus]|uniref:ATP-dependent helicase HrpB n=1 Tax=Pseudokineococcus lusitanus TaxID=763993 RepID=A0A3N1HMW1_9ACTN|nr:ATP-dependent helicase HrpB [Pseudokineococcus lusitanus]ROP43820.1 ATP-dependent helicase HrpB [Pseudokineococcus lusitanus]
MGPGPGAGDAAAEPLLDRARRRGGDLPVVPALGPLVAALDAAGAALLVAPPGTGKTTLAPLALADALAGAADGATRVLVTEPRRVAVRAAARRAAALLDEPVGRTVGYAVRGERRGGPRTRVEVVTTGLLVRRLQADPELAGVGAVLLDEVHERSLDADLALALLLDVRAALRPSLRLVAASATPDVGAWRRAMAAAGADGGGDGTEVPVVVATAPTYPLDVRLVPPPAGLEPPRGLRVDPRLLAHVAGVVGQALAERPADEPGDVLVVLPGAREIARVAGLVRDAHPDVDVVALHGRTPAAEQDAALRPGPRRRVVVASAVAESSLTVPGVRVVVDAGLARVPRTDHARGLGGLDTVRVSRASADQRAGRAAREGSGVALRCWSAADDARLPPRAEPEVATADLASAALLLAAWGTPGGRGAALPDPLPAGALAAAERVLRDRGLVAEDGTPTPLGRAVAGVGLDPRLGRALLVGAPAVGERRCAEVVALLSEDGLVGGRGADDLVAAWRALRRGDDPARSGRWRQEVGRLRAALAEAGDVAGTAAARAGALDDAPGGALDDDRAAGLVVALAHPERVARARRGGGGAGTAAPELLMAGGTGARLVPGSAWTTALTTPPAPGEGPAWLAVAVVDRPLGSADAVVRAAAPLDEDLALRAAEHLRTSEDEVRWAGGADGDVVARRVTRLGALVLADRPLADPPRDALAAALLDGLRRAGLALLAPSAGAERLRQRLAVVHRALGAPWPDVGEAALVARAPEWLGPELQRARTRRQLAGTDVAGALRRLLPWPEAGRLDVLVPEHVVVPSGRSVRLDLADPAAPVLAVRLQDVLGWEDAPRLVDGRVPVVVHLLSPAGRPLAVTADLASFWRGPYAGVRAEMRGRYPKHAWPADPLAPTGGRAPGS